jgi:hypothetical protein
MIKNTKMFLLLTAIVMLLFGIWMRASFLVPPQTAAGPVLVTHGWDKDTCDICHRKSVDWHEKTFGFFNSCKLCHEGGKKTPHGTTGSFSYCLGCHETIVPSHDRMFPFKNATYKEDCLGCHPGN